MNVCCVSDLHGRLPEIPPCDLFIIAGDVCPDMHFRAYNNPDVMRARQMQWLTDEFEPWRSSVPAKRTMMTPGNHDWITRLPEGVDAGFYIDELVEWEGKRFWFTPWVNYCGDWNYLLPTQQRAERFAEMPPGLDVLVSHSPAYDIGDRAYNGDRAGCCALRDVICRRQPKYCVFGHIHEGVRRLPGIEDGRLGPRSWKLGSTIMYNVAMFGQTWEPLVLHI